MKTILFRLLCAVMLLGATNSFGQYLTDWGRAEAEGIAIDGVQGSFTGVVGVGASQGAAPMPGTMWMLSNVSVSTNDSVNVAVQLTNAAITPSSKVPPYWGIIFGAGGGRENRYYGHSNTGQTGVNVSFLKGSTKSNFQMRWSASGIRVSADFFKPADKKLLLLADSFGEGSTVSTAEQTYQFQVIDSLEKYTRWRWRVINKARGGHRSSDIEGLRNQYNLYFSDIGAIIYAVATNDTDTAAYRANLTKFLAWAPRVYTRQPILVCAPATRADASTQETTNITLRIIAQNVVTALANPRIKVINWGALWTQAQQATYLVGDKIHPNVAGHAAIANQIWGAFKESGGDLIRFTR